MKEEDSLSMSKSYDAEGSRAWPWRGQARGPVGQGGEPRQAHPACPAASGSSAAGSTRGAWHTGQSLRSGPTKSELRTIS